MRRPLLFALAGLTFALIAIACGDEKEPINVDPTTVSGAGSTGGGGGDGGGTSTGTGMTTGSGMPGTGGAGMAPTGAEEWSEGTTSTPGLKPALAYDDTYGVYAIVNDRARWWNGTTWSTITDQQAGLRSALHVIADPLGQGGGGGLGQGGQGGLGGAPPMPGGQDVNLAAVVVNEIYRWDGLNWNSITGPAPGLQNEFHYISDVDIYAVVDEHVEWWDGLAWTLTTLDQPGLKDAMHFVSESEIYAVVDEQIDMWNGTAWVPFAPGAPGLRPAIDFKSPTEVYAVIGTQVCWYNGTEWAPLSDELMGLEAELIALSPSNFWVTNSDDRVWNWAAPML